MGTFLFLSLTHTHTIVPWAGSAFQPRLASNLGSSYLNLPNAQMTSAALHVHFPPRSALLSPNSYSFPAPSLGSFGTPRTSVPLAGSNSGSSAEAPTSSPGMPATSPPSTGSNAQQQLMQQMIQFLSGSGNSQVHRVIAP